MYRNLLVVEDDAGIRNLIVMYFKKEKFNVFEAEDGEEALMLFKSSPSIKAGIPFQMRKMESFSALRWRFVIPGFSHDFLFET